ncbi:MAG: DUF429 domain-containing protein, partial [Methanosarcinaceae archaeon]|nr:DUF429 domain-containing protein [Methanosarcinaceae archaeon]
IPDGEGLLIQECFRAKALPNSGRALKSCLPALVNLVKCHLNAVFGFDFPFGLPASLVQENTWEEFVLAFHTRFKDPDDFKKMCFTGAGDRELRRQTDNEAHTPFSPYNLRIYKQTYYGIREILTPLVRNMQACVLPMQKPSIAKPWILEICPASILKTHNLYQKYKYRNRRDDRPETRSHILKEIEKQGPLRFQDNEIRETVIQDRNGDSLDSVIAAFATFRAVQEGLSPGEGNEDYMIEGYVFV